MKRQQAYKFELMPSGKQRRDMTCFAGSRRYVYNRALKMQQEIYAAGGKYIQYREMAKWLTGWRNDPATPWLKESPVHGQQAALSDLDLAFKAAFAKIRGFPKKKHPDDGDSFHFSDKKHIHVDQINHRIKLPKLGWIRYRGHREVVGEVRNATISLKCGKWFVSIQTEYEADVAIPVATKAIGIDVGITRFATLSDGSFFAPVNAGKKALAKLAKYQRRMAKKKKGSKNHKKTKAKVQRIHRDIANIRKDFLHKTSTEIVANYSLICIEDLQIKNMSGSAKGTKEKPGNRVKQKSGLNRAILDQGWGEFRRQLEYKSKWNGGIVIAVPPQYTSQTCPDCGHVDKANRKTQAHFECVSCGCQENADVVGALNILERGHRLLACGENSDKPVRKLGSKLVSKKQEPTEAKVTGQLLFNTAVGAPEQIRGGLQ